jgi:hypothetical protein
VRLAMDIKIAGDDGSTYVGQRLTAGAVLELGRR